MKTGFYLSFLLLLAIDTFNQVAFKLAGEAALPMTFDTAWFSRLIAEPWTYAIIGGYVSAFLVYMALLRRSSVGVVFAASHLEIVTVLIVSVVFFEERQTLLQWIGCFAIMAGVALLGVTEREDERDHER